MSLHIIGMIAPGRNRGFCRNGITRTTGNRLIRPHSRNIVRPTAKRVTRLNFRIIIR